MPGALIIYILIALKAPQGPEGKHRPENLLLQVPPVGPLMLLPAGTPRPAAGPVLLT